MMTLLAAALAAALSASPVVAPIGWGNGLTLPAQRHVVRLEPPGRPPYLLVAVQEDHDGPGGLNFWRSDDGGATWRFEAPVQPDPSHRDTADLVRVGDDVALVFSWEGPNLSGDARSDVWFQWWRMDPATGALVPQPAVRVFDSTSDATAYSRGELAVDSHGRIWVQAFFLETDGSSTAVVAVSEDGGATFTVEPPLDHLSARGGGRISSASGKLVFLYGSHDAFMPGRMRVRDDAAPLDQWGPVDEPIPEGIYHGAALSVAPDGAGGLHVVTKSHEERLVYRHFDGRALSAPVDVTGVGDWAIQPAVTRVGDAAVICFNRPVAVGRTFEFRVVAGGALSDPVVLDDTRTFKTYPNALEQLSPGQGDVPCFFGDQLAEDQDGVLRVAMAPAPSGGGSQPPPPPPPPPPPAPPPDGTLLFADGFERTASDLGAGWAVRGGYAEDGNAVSTAAGVPDRATALAATCLDCVAEALVRPGSALEAGVFVRGAVATSDRYDAILVPGGGLALRRLDAGRPTVLALGPSGASSTAAFTRVTLAVSGTAPVLLVASVDGVERLRATDASATAVTHAGNAGLWTYDAGVRFDAFTLRDLGASPPPPPPPLPPPPPPPRPGSVLFSDAFDRTTGLGPGWSLRGGFATDGAAVSTLDGVPDRATATGAPACADCRVEAIVTPGAAVEAGVFVRGAQEHSNRYDAILVDDGRLLLRRLDAGRPTVLAERASGVDPLAASALALTATGAGPVTLAVELNGVEVLRATDASAAAIGVAAFAGLWTYSAGVRFDAFALRSAP